MHIFAQYRHVIYRWKALKLSILNLKRGGIGSWRIYVLENLFIGEFMVIVFIVKSLVEAPLQYKTLPFLPRLL